MARVKARCFALWLVLKRTMKARQFCQNGYTVGFLEQEPQLDESKTVRQIVEEGVQEVVDALQEFDAINMKFGEEMTDEEDDRAHDSPG